MTGAADTITVLHVDDTPEFVDPAAAQLEQADAGLTVRTATHPDDALAILSASGSGARSESVAESKLEPDIDCVVSDYDLPGRNGIAFLEAVREEHPELPFVLYTGTGSEEIASDAIAAGVTDYLPKNTGADPYETLAKRIRNAVSTRRAGVAAAERRDRLEQILTTVPSCVVQLDYEGRFVFANDRATAVLGLTESDLTDRAYNDPAWAITDLDGDPIPDEDLPFRRVRDTGEPVSGVIHTIEWPDGTRKILHINGAPLFDADGNVDSVVFSLSDVTERTRRERELEQARAEYEQLIEGMNDAAWVIDADGSFLAVNGAAVEITGYGRSELLSMSLRDIDVDVDPDSDDARAYGLDRLRGPEIASDDRRVFETVHRTRDGEQIPVEVSSSVVDYRGQAALLSVARDVTARKERERRMEEFASVISHDLRNPLNVAQGSVELARDEHPSEHLDRAEQAHTRMQDLIDDLLTLARHGEAAIDPEPIDLGALTEACWRTVSTGTATLDVTCSRTIAADRGRLQQFLENLLRNAVEHGSTSPEPAAHGDADGRGPTTAETGSEAGTEETVHITVGDLDDPPTGGGFYVADDGPGIPPDSRDAVFESGHSTAPDGTGFGLHIVAEIAAEHGWSIRVTDADSGGARFEVTGVTPVDAEPDG